MPVDGADRAVVALASRRHAVVTAAELAEAGLSRHAVAHRLGTGWLRRMHRGVYLVGPLEAPHSRAMAATLAAGAGAVLSHHPAAVLWGFRPPREGPIDVTVPDRKTRGRPGIRVHRSHLHPTDMTRKDGMQRRVSTHSLTEQFKRYPQHRGTAALRKALRTDPALTRSEAERRFLELIRAARLPEPEANTQLQGYEVDFLWREAALIVEVDGYAFHSSRSSFERDRGRDATLAGGGWRVVRFTWWQIVEEPEAVIARLAAALAA